MVENLSATTGRNQTSVVYLRKVVTETGVVERVRKLKSAQDSKSLNQFAKERAEEASGETSANNTSNWKTLMSLFCTDSWNKLVTLLGFSKEDIANKVPKRPRGRKLLSYCSGLSPTTEEELVASGVRELVVTLS